MIDPQDLLNVAIGAARDAGALIEEMAAAGIKSKDKGFRDIVTEADLASQKLIVDYINARFPNHGFIGEEEDDALSSEADTLWIIDPIDGTSNYSHQIPAYCVSIGVAVGGEVVAGVVYDPKRDELFAASKDGGATLNGEPISVSTTASLSDALVAHDWSRPTASRTTVHGILDNVIHNSRTVRAFGSAALVMCWIGCGRIDSYFNISIGPWDWAGASIVLNEAGGAITNWSNETPSVFNPTTSIAASNSNLQTELLSYLKTQAA